MPREILPPRRFQITIPMFYAYREYHVSLGFYDADRQRPAELFISSHKEDGALSAIARDAAVATSIALQFGVPLFLLRDALNKVENEGAVPNPSSGDAAGILGAALDAIWEARPDLYEQTSIGASEYSHPVPGEPSFTLLGRDPQAPGLIDLWADVRALKEPDSAKIESARKLADDMRQFKNEHDDLGLPRDAFPIISDDVIMLNAALSTLERLGYKWNGGVEWRPPLGKSPAYIQAELNQDDRIKILEAEVKALKDHRDIQGGTIISLQNKLLQKKQLINIIQDDNKNKYDQILMLVEENEKLTSENQALHDQLGAALDRITEQVVETRSVTPLFRAGHLKRETAYDVLNVCVKVQTDIPLVDMDSVVLYRADSSQLIVRPHREFFDGRFQIGHDLNSKFEAEPSVMVLEPRVWRQEYGLRLAHSIWGNCVYDADERRRRMVEELYELIQASLIPSHERIAIEHEVFSRPPGDVLQELGGASFTMMLYAQSRGCSLESCEVAEINRVRTKDPQILRERHAEKIRKGIATGNIPSGTVTDISDIVGGNFGR